MQVKNCNIKITHNTMPHYKKFFYNFNNPTKVTRLYMTKPNNNGEQKIQTISLDRMSIYSFGVPYNKLTLVQKINVHWALMTSDLIVTAILAHRFIRNRYTVTEKFEKESGDIAKIIKINRKAILTDLLTAVIVIGGTIVLKHRFGKIIFSNVKKSGSWFFSKLPIIILRKTFNLFKKILYQIIIKPIKIIFNIILLPFKIVFKLILKLIAFPFLFLFKIIKNLLFQRGKDPILTEEDLTVKQIQEYIRKYKGEDNDLSVLDIISIINNRLKLERGYMRQIKICLSLLRALHEKDITWDEFMKYVLYYGTDELYAFMDFIRRGGRSLFSSQKYPEDLPPISDLYREPENAIHRRFIQPFSKKPPTLPSLNEPTPHLPPLDEPPTVPRFPPFPPLKPLREPDPIEHLHKSYEDIINEKVKLKFPKKLRKWDKFLKPLTTAFGAYVLASFVASPKTQKEFSWILKNFNADPGLKPVSA